MEESTEDTEEEEGGDEGTGDENELIGIDDTIDSAIDNLISGLVSNEDTAEEVASTTKVAIPIVVTILFVLACIIACILMTQGLCCSCCYDKVPQLQKYKKRSGSRDSLGGEPGDERSSHDKSKSNYASMGRAKDGQTLETTNQKNVYVDDSANQVNRPSILNFDNFDATNASVQDVTDLETPNKGGLSNPKKPKESKA